MVGASALRGGDIQLQHATKRMAKEKGTVFFIRERGGRKRKHMKYPCNTGVPRRGEKHGSRIAVGE
jgi:hypothetical protein